MRTGAETLRLLSLLGAATLPTFFPDSLGAQRRDSAAFTGEMWTGVRDVRGDRTASKFLEYRDLPRGVFLEHFRLDWRAADRPVFAEVLAQNALQEDEFYRLSVGRIGHSLLEVTWDQVPHALSNMGASFYAGVGGATLTLPDVLRRTLQSSTNASADLQSFLAGAVPVPLRFRRDKGTVSLRHEPTPDWTVRVRYHNEEIDGTRPLGTVIGPNPGPSGTVVELPQPLSYRTHQVEATVERATRRWSVEVGYAGSLFRNADEALTWDNPLRLVDAIGGAPSGPARGRAALPPDNSAHSVHVSSAVALPLLHSRLVGTVAYSALLQDRKFLSHTVNTAISDPGLALPRSSLDGRINTVLVNWLVSTRIARGVSLAARYRLYDLDNQTPALDFPAHVVNDAILSTTERRNLPYGYRKQNAGVDVSWRAIRQVSLRGGYEWERWDRDFREVKQSNERIGKMGVDFAPVSWAHVRASYWHGAREPKAYDPFAPRASYPGDSAEPGELPQLVQLRKFDEASRARDRVAVLGELSPLEPLVVTGSFGRSTDDYDATPYGVQGRENWDASFQATYALSPRVSLSADYTHDVGESRMRSRQRRLGVPDSSLNDWASRLEDEADSYGVGLDWLVVPAKDLALSVGYTLEVATGRVRTAKLDPASTLVTTAVDYPAVRHRLRLLAVSVDYGLAQDLVANARYRFERFTEDDFANDVMAPFVGGLANSGAARDVFLGARFTDYEAHILTLSLKWVF